MANIYDMADTWNDAGTVFTAIKMNVTDTASDSASLLMDLQVGGSSRFIVGKSGNVSATFGNTTTSSVIVTGSNVGYSSQLKENALVLRRAASISWADSNNAFGTVDLIVARDAANTLAQRNSTNPQAFNIYNTYTNASNYERAKLEWSSNRLVLDTEEAGTGLARGITIGGADLVLASLPTSDPVAAGQLWNDAGTLKVSAG